MSYLRRKRETNHKRKARIPRRKKKHEGELWREGEQAVLAQCSGSAGPPESDAALPHLAGTLCGHSVSQGSVFTSVKWG